MQRFKVLIVSGFFIEHAVTDSSRHRSALWYDRVSPNDASTAPEHAHRLAASAKLETIVADDSPTCRRGRGAAEKCIPWVQKMRRMCDLHNCTGALLDGGCGTNLPDGQRWRCLLGRYAASVGGLPTFYINSALDSWQMVNVWRQYARCRWDDKQCTPERTDADLALTNTMLRAFVRELRDSGALGRRGNGAFIYSCNEHVAGLANAAFLGYTVGGTTMRQALHAWWVEREDAPAARHTYLPCELRRHTGGANGTAWVKAPAHHACNPSCDKYRMKRRLSQDCPCSP